VKKNIKKEVINFLKQDVQELVDGFDWLGTGSDSRWAAKEQREWQEKLDAMIAKVEKEG